MPGNWWEFSPSGQSYKPLNEWWRQARSNYARFYGLDQGEPEWATGTQYQVPRQPYLPLTWRGGAGAPSMARALQRAAQPAPPQPAEPQAQRPWWQLAGEAGAARSLLNLPAEGGAKEWAQTVREQAAGLKQIPQWLGYYWQEAGRRVEEVGEQRERIEERKEKEAEAIPVTSLPTTPEGWEEYKKGYLSPEGPRQVLPTLWHQLQRTQFAGGPITAAEQLGAEVMWAVQEPSEFAKVMATGPAISAEAERAEIPFEEYAPLVRAGYSLQNEPEQLRGLLQQIKSGEVEAEEAAEQAYNVTQELLGYVALDPLNAWDVWNLWRKPMAAAEKARAFKRMTEAGPVDTQLGRYVVAAERKIADEADAVVRGLQETEAARVAKMAEAVPQVELPGMPARVSPELQEAQKAAAAARARAEAIEEVARVLGLPDEVDKAEKLRELWAKTTFDLIPRSKVSKYLNEMWMVLAKPLDDVLDADEALRLLRGDEALLARYGRTFQSPAGKSARVILATIADDIEGLPLFRAAKKVPEEARAALWDGTSAMLQIEGLAAMKLAGAFKIRPLNKVQKALSVYKRVINELYLNPRLSGGYIVRQVFGDSSNIIVDGANPFQKLSDVKEFLDRFGTGTRRLETRGAERMADIRGFAESLGPGQQPRYKSPFPGKFGEWMERGMEQVRRKHGLGIPGTKKRIFTRVPVGEEARYMKGYAAHLKPFLRENFERFFPNMPDELTAAMGQTASEHLVQRLLGEVNADDMRAAVEEAIKATKPGEILEPTMYLEASQVADMSPTVVKKLREAARKLPADATPEDIAAAMDEVRKAVDDDVAERMAEIQDLPKKRRVATDTESAELVEEVADAVEEVAKESGIPELVDEAGTIREEMREAAAETKVARDDAIQLAVDIDHEDAANILYDTHLKTRRLREEVRARVDNMMRQVRELYVKGVRKGDELWPRYFWAWTEQFREMERGQRAIFLEGHENLRRLHAGDSLDDILGVSRRKMEELKALAVSEPEQIARPGRFTPGFVKDREEWELFDQLQAALEAEREPLRINAWRALYRTKTEDLARALDILISTDEHEYILWIKARGRQLKALRKIREEADAAFKLHKGGKMGKLAARRVWEAWPDIRNAIWSEADEAIRATWKAAEEDVTANRWLKKGWQPRPLAPGAIEPADQALMDSFLAKRGKGEAPTVEEWEALERWVGAGPPTGEEGVQRGLEEAALAPEGKVPVEEAPKPKVYPRYTREQFNADLRRVFPYTEEEAQQVQQISEAIRDTWARWTGRDPDEFYDWFASLEKGAEGDLFQRAPAPDTAEFRKWFGNSKVVDEGGNPRVVYHGTMSPRAFEQFQAGMPYIEDEWGEMVPLLSPSGSPDTYIGTHFAEEPEIAAGFAMPADATATWQKARWGVAEDVLEDFTAEAGPRIYPAHLSVQNPIVFEREEDWSRFMLDRDMGSTYDMDWYSGEWAYQNDSTVEEFWQRYEADPDFRLEANDEVFNQPTNEGGSFNESFAADIGYDLKRQLREMGHDGVRYKNDVEGGWSWIALNPEQIKSPWNLRPTEDPRLLYQKAQTRQWFYRAEQAIEQRMGKTGHIQQVESILRKSGVSAEELESTAILEWLKAQKGRVSKEDVLSYLRENRLEVMDVTRGAGLPADHPAQIAYADAQGEVFLAKRDLDRELTQVQGWGTADAAEAINNIQQAADRGNRAGVYDDRFYLYGARAYQAAPSGTVRYHQALLALRDADEALTASWPARTKWGQYVEPGAIEGTYRELLIHLPAPMATRPIERELRAMQAEWTRTVRTDPELARLTARADELQTWLRANEPPNLAALYFGDASALPPDQLEAFERYQAANREMRWIQGNITDKMAEVFPDMAERQNDLYRRLREARKETFAPPHWPEEDVLAHVRYNERQLPTGERGFFMEELQSDWHQAGYEEGYIPPGAEERLREISREQDELAARRRQIMAERNYIREHEVGTYEYRDAERRRLFAEAEENLARDEALVQEAADIRETIPKYGVPSAPLETKWPEMSMKRMLREAAENEAEFIGWTTAQQQLDRYPAEVHWRKLKEGESVSTWQGRTHIAGAGPEWEVWPTIAGEDRGVLFHNVITNLEDLKNVDDPQMRKWAPKIWAALQESPEGGMVEPLRKGMEHWYDNAYPNIMKKLGKRYGLKVEFGRIGAAAEEAGKLRYASVSVREAAERMAARGAELPAPLAVYGDPSMPEYYVVFDTELGAIGGTSVPYQTRVEAGGEAARLNREAQQAAAGFDAWYMKLTPEAREKILSEGFSLFQGAKRGATQFLEDGRAIIRALESADKSTFLHELMHVARRYLPEEDIDVLRRWAIAEGERMNRLAEAGTLTKAQRDAFFIDEAGEATELCKPIKTDDTLAAAGEELIARAWERYLYEGIAPSERLRQAFERIKQFMVEIYKKIKGGVLDVELSDPVRGVFDRMLESEPELLRELDWRGKQLAEAPLEAMQEAIEHFRQERHPLDVNEALEIMGLGDPPDWEGLARAMELQKGWYADRHSPKHLDMLAHAWAHKGEPKPISAFGKTVYTTRTKSVKAQREYRSMLIGGRKGQAATNWYRRNQMLTGHYEELEKAARAAAAGEVYRFVPDEELVKEQVALREWLMKEVPQEQLDELLYQKGPEQGLLWGAEEEMPLFTGTRERAVETPFVPRDVEPKAEQAAFMEPAERPVAVAHFKKDQRVATPDGPGIVTAAGADESMVRLDEGRLKVFKNSELTRGKVAPEELRPKRIPKGQQTLWQEAVDDAAGRLHNSQVEESGYALHDDWTEVLEAGKQSVLNGIDNVQEGLIRDWDKAWKPQAERMAAGKIANDWLENEVLPVWWDVAAAGMKYADSSIHRSILDYENIRGFDVWLSYLFPYHYWYTRNGYNWLRRFMYTPGILSHYLYSRDAMKLANQNAGRRERFGDMVEIPFPWLPDWMGDSLYLNVDSLIFPYSNLFGDNWDDSEGRSRGLRRFADMSRKYGLRPYHIWEFPYQKGWYADLASMMGMEKGEAEETLAPERRDEFGFLLPQTGFLRSATAYAHARGVEQIPPGGINIEAPVRRALGLPAGETWDPYRISRMLGTMAAEDKTNAALARLALMGQELISQDPAQTQQPWSEESELAKRIALEKDWSDEDLADAQELLREAVNRAQLESGVRSVGWALGPRLAIEPAGEAAQLEMARQAKGTIWTEEQPEGTYEAYRGFKEQYPAMYPRAAQYQILPGEQEYEGLSPGDRANWMARTEEQQRIYDDYTERMDEVLRSRPWDDDALSPLWDERKAELAAAEEKYPLPPFEPDEPGIYYGMSPDEEWDARVEFEIQPFLDKRPDGEDYWDGDDFDYDRYRSDLEEWAVGLPELSFGEIEGGTYEGMSTAEAIDAYQRRHDSPLMALHKVWKETVREPTWALYNQLRDAGDKDAWDKVIAPVGEIPGSELVEAVLKAYPERGWSAAQLRAAYSGVTFPPLADTRGEESKQRGVFWNRYYQLPSGVEPVDDPAVQLILDPDTRATATPEQYEYAIKQIDAWLQRNPEAPIARLEQDELLKEAERKWPGVLTLQERYFALATREEKGAFLDNNPDLRYYWKWRKGEWAREHPTWTRYYLDEADWPTAGGGAGAAQDTDRYAAAKAAYEEGGWRAVFGVPWWERYGRGTHPVGSRRGRAPRQAYWGPRRRRIYGGPWRG